MGRVNSLYMLPCPKITYQADIGLTYPKYGGKILALKWGCSYQSNHIIRNFGSRVIDPYWVYFQSKAKRPKRIFAWGHVLKIRDVIIGLASVYMVYLKSPRCWSKKSGRNNAVHSNVFPATGCVKPRYQVAKGVQLEASNAGIAMAIDAMNRAYSSAVRCLVEPFPVRHGFPLFFHGTILAREAM